MPVQPWDFNSLLRYPGAPPLATNNRPALLAPAPDAAADLVATVMTNPDLRQIQNDSAALPSRVMDETGAMQRLVQRTAPSSVPVPQSAPSPVLKVVPGGNAAQEFREPSSASDIGSLSGLLMQVLGADKIIANAITMLNAKIDLQLRIDWIKMILDNSNSPTRFQQPLLPDGSSFVSGNAAYATFYTNVRPYPIGIRIAATWVTPGGALNFSMNPSNQTIFAALSNGGPAGGALSTVKILKPNETVFAGNNDPGVPLAATDTFIVQIIDPAEYLTPEVFQVLPYAP